MSVAPRIAALHVYPVKSCRGIALETATVHAEGIEHDRRWMLVDRSGRFVSQREHPELARVVTALDDGFLRISLYGHGNLRIALRPAPGERLRTSVWDATLDAVDAGDEAADWFSDLLGETTRLARFPPDAQRRCDPRWAPQAGARTLFSDGFPLLVLGEASVGDLARRMGLAALAVERFRPNLVLSGLPAYDEDFIGRIRFGELELALVKPCARCTIPSVHPRDGVADGIEPLEALKTFRFDPRVGGATLGVNAIVVSGAGAMLRRGQVGHAEWAFGAEPR